MASTQTQTATLPTGLHKTTQPLVLTGRVTKPPTRSTRTKPSKPLLSYSPQIPTPHPDIPISLLRNKLLLTCRPYIPSSLTHAALTDGIYSRATHWLTPRSQLASRNGKAKRYYVLHTDDFSLQQVSSAWEARVCSGSRGIDAGNGVVVFVKERSEWEGVMRGYRRQGRRAGELVRTKEREVERGWREMWRGKCCGGDGWEGEKDGAKDGGQGPMWYLVRRGVERIRRGEA